MYIRKTYVSERFTDDYTAKARDDVFVPVTQPSVTYKIWNTVLDIKTCFICADNHGRIFAVNDPILIKPPVHIGCRCTLEKIEAIEAGNATNNGTDGADYWLKYYGRLPDYYISYPQLEALGWRYGDRPSKFAPGKILGGNVYENRDSKLPTKVGRVWYEADINYTQGRRNKHRIFWSNDGLIFVTYDHGHTFYEIV